MESIYWPLKSNLKKMKKILTLLVLAVFFIQCGNEQDILLGKNQVGKIDKNTSLSELDKIFKKDSVERYPSDSELTLEYRVFDLEGKPSLIIIPKIQNDSVKGMELIKVYSKDYHTEKGISTASTFKDIANNYSIDKIEPSFSAAILFINELNATISLNKKDLKLDEFDMRAIRQDQIPDEANINYMTFWLE